MSGKKIIEGLRDVLAGRVTRVTIVTRDGRRLPPEEAEKVAAAMNEAFGDMRRAMDKIGDALK